MSEKFERAFIEGIKAFLNTYGANIAATAGSTTQVPLPDNSHCGQRLLKTKPEWTDGNINYYWCGKCKAKFNKDLTPGIRNWTKE